MKIEALGFFIANCLPLQEAQNRMYIHGPRIIKEKPFSLLIFRCAHLPLFKKSNEVT